MSWCKSFGSRTSKHKYPPVCLPACVPGLYSDFTISHIWGWRVESGGMGWNWGWQIWGTPWFPTLHIFIIMKFTIFMEKWILLFKWLRHCLRVWCPDVRTWHGADGRYSPVEGQEVSLCSVLTCFSYRWDVPCSSPLTSVSRRGSGLPCKVSRQKVIMTISLVKVTGNIF